MCKTTNTSFRRITCPNGIVGALIPARNLQAIRILKTVALSTATRIGYVEKVTRKVEHKASLDPVNQQCSTLPCLHTVRCTSCCRPELLLFLFYKILKVFYAVVCDTGMPHVLSLLYSLVLAVRYFIFKLSERLNLLKHNRKVLRQVFFRNFVISSLKYSSKSLHKSFWLNL